MKITQYTRLYRGEPENAEGGLGHHFTKSVDRARGFAGKNGKVYYVDVHMNDMGSLKPSRVPGMNYIVPEHLRKEKKLMESTIRKPMTLHRKMQIKYRIIDENSLKNTLINILEYDESRREHDKNWVKPKNEKKKPRQTKVVIEPNLKEPEKEG